MSLLTRGFNTTTSLWFLLREHQAWSKNRPMAPSLPPVHWHRHTITGRTPARHRGAVEAKSGPAVAGRFGAEGCLWQDGSVTGVCPARVCLLGQRSLAPGGCHHRRGGWQLLLWASLSVVASLLPKPQPAGPRAMLLSPPGRKRGWVGGTGEVSARGGCRLVCAQSGAGGSWAAGAQGLGSPLAPQHGCFPRRSPGCWGCWAALQHGQPALHRSSVLPAAPRDARERGAPRPRIVLLSCRGLSHITSRFSRFGAALGAGWLIVTSLVVLGREGWCLPSHGWSAAERVG